MATPRTAPSRGKCTGATRRPKLLPAMVEKRISPPFSRLFISTSGPGKPRSTRSTGTPCLSPADAPSDPDTVTSFWWFHLGNQNAGRTAPREGAEPATVLAVAGSALLSGQQAERLGRGTVAGFLHEL